MRTNASVRVNIQVNADEFHCLKLRKIKLPHSIPSDEFARLYFPQEWVDELLGETNQFNSWDLVDNAASALLNVAEWDKTPQGYVYWRVLCIKMKQ